MPRGNFKSETLPKQMFAKYDLFKIFFFFCRPNRLIEPFTNIFQLKRTRTCFFNKFLCKFQFFWSKFLMKSETLHGYVKNRKQCPEVTSALSEKYLPLNWLVLTSRDSIALSGQGQYLPVKPVLTSRDSIGQSGQHLYSEVFGQASIGQL